MPNDPREHLKAQVGTLVDKFERHHDEYMRPDYSEADVRSEFIDPLFEALGWDVQNCAGASPKDREVIREKGETQGRVDYTFRLEGRTVFFVEAKAPHVPLDRVDVVMQAKSYAWHSRDVFVAAVTDFEEFRLYDATAKPDRKHPNAGLIFNYRYTDYPKPKTLDDLWLLSRQAVAAGSIDQLLKKSSVQARQRIPVDQAFLDDLSAWREQLAKAVFKAHSDLSPADLNSVVQVFLDRLIFIRICEDRRIMAPRRLIETAENWEYSGKRVSISNDLNALFREVNDRLNGEIFKPQECEKIDWDINAALVVDIIKHLYFPASPYMFDKIPVELLGSIYERYLGKTIRVTATRAIVEDKPEVRKAGGVYYTPKYIVDYIVEQTVGKLIEGKTPKQIANLRFLDPACGSGSFLLGAYQKLLDYHKQYYEEHARMREANSGQPRLLEAEEGGEFRLSLDEKAAILRNNIFGVDIDPQAVEITMMSLYIKMLEDERRVLEGRALLPRLRDNIKCGNSLVGYDIGELDDAERARINPFDWNSKSEGFGEILAAGGFDAVIGNPPYIRSQSLNGEDRKYYDGKYETATGTYDIYVLFVERAAALTNETAKCGFILPNKFFTTSYGEGLRRMLGGQHLVERLVDFEDAQVFSSAGTYTTLVFLSKEYRGEPQYTRMGSVYRDSGAAGLASKLRSPDLPFFPLALTTDGSRWTLAAGESGKLLIRLQRGYQPFSTLNPHIFQALITGADKIYLVHVRKHRGALSEIVNGLGYAAAIETRMLRPVVKGEHVQRYFADTSAGLAIIYPYDVDSEGKASVMTREELSGRFPKTWEYLNGYKKILGSRDRGIWSKRHDWYAYARNQNIAAFLNPKFLVPYMAAGLKVAQDQDCQLFFVNISTGGYGLIIDGEPHHRRYFLGILNSLLMSYCIRQMTNRFRGGYFAVNKQALERLPIRTINFADPVDKARHDKMVALVERMIELHTQKQAAKSDVARERIEREIKVTDEQIDALVYELYGLTEEEIKIVET